MHQKQAFLAVTSDAPDRHSLSRSLKHSSQIAFFTSALTLSVYEFDHLILVAAVVTLLQGNLLCLAAIITSVAHWILSKSSRGSISKSKRQARSPRQRNSFLLPADLDELSTAIKTRMPSFLCQYATTSTWASCSTAKVPSIVRAKRIMMVSCTTSSHGSRHERETPKHQKDKPLLAPRKMFAASNGNHR